MAPHFTGRTFTDPMGTRVNVTRPHLGSRFQSDCSFRLQDRIMDRSVNFRFARYPLDALFSCWKALLALVLWPYFLGALLAR